MKKKIIIIFTILLFVFATNSYGIDDKIISSQADSLNISGFIEEAKKYTENIFPEMDISNLFENVIKGNIDNKTIINGFINKAGNEIKTTIRTIAIILIIVVIHSIFKTISESLGNESISQITYYLQYILIVTTIMNNFSEIIKLTIDSISELVNFMHMLIPLLITLMLTTGSIVSANIVQPMLLFIITFIGNIISSIIIPVILISTIFSIISNISSKVQINKLSNFFKSSIIWILRSFNYGICRTFIYRRNSK